LTAINFSSFFTALCRLSINEVGNEMKGVYSVNQITFSPPFYSGCEKSFLRDFFREKIGGENESKKAFFATHCFN
jgi:hypothetical protein